MNTFLIPDASDEFNQKHDLSKHSHLPAQRNPWRDPYWYRTQFFLPPAAQRPRTWLNFKAINCRADVWLNGRRIADHQTMVGALQRFRFDISDAAASGLNHLAVKVHPVDHAAEPDTQLEVFGNTRAYQKDLMKDVTLPMFIGYNCMPPVPDRNMGLWQGVSVDFTGAVDIRAG